MRLNRTRVTGCGRSSGVGTWKKAVVIAFGVITALFGFALLYYGLRMWWELSGSEEEAAQYMIDRLAHAETPLDLVRIKWEHEIVLQDCQSDRQPCESPLVKRNRRCYRTVLAISLLLSIVGIMGVCGASCENNTALFLYVLAAGAIALVEFFLMVFLLQSHHQITTVTPWVRQVMKVSLPPQTHIPDVSPEETEAFYRAMGWLDEMNNFDQSLVQPHLFSWRDQLSSFASSARDWALHIMLDNGTATLYDQQQQQQQDRPTVTVRYIPMCVRGRSSLGRRRSAVSDADEFRNTVNSFVRDAADDYSDDTKWKGLAKDFDFIWNLNNMTLNEKAYEVAVNQQCLYTINIRILQELKKCEEMAPPVLVCGLLALFAFPLHALSAVAAHLLVRTLRNHFESMIRRQREARDAGVTVVTNTNNTTSTTNSSQQQQQQQMMMAPMMMAPQMYPQYAAPPQQMYGPPHQAYVVPQQGYEPIQQGCGYGVPQQGFGVLQHGYGAPQHGYTVPQHSYGAPQQEYGAPPQSTQSASQDLLTQEPSADGRQPASRGDKAPSGNGKSEDSAENWQTAGLVPQASPRNYQSSQADQPVLRKDCLDVGPTEASPGLCLDGRGPPPRYSPASRSSAPVPHTDSPAASHSRERGNNPFINVSLHIPDPAVRAQQPESPADPASHPCNRSDQTWERTTPDQTPTSLPDAADREHL